MSGFGWATTGGDSIWSFTPTATTSGASWYTGRLRHWYAVCDNCGWEGRARSRQAWARRDNRRHLRRCHGG